MLLRTTSESTTSAGKDFVAVHTQGNRTGPESSGSVETQVTPKATS